MLRSCCRTAGRSPRMTRRSPDRGSRPARGSSRRCVTVKCKPAPVSAASAGAPAPAGVTEVIEEFFPIMAEGKVYAVVGLWRDAGPILAQLEQVRFHILSVVIAAALISLALLYFVFAQRSTG